MRSGQQQTLIAIANLALGVIIMMPLVYHAAYGITYSNAAIVTQDLAMTINTMQSVPVPTQVQYQPDTAEYIISLSQSLVSVQSSDGTFKRPIYTPKTANIQPSKAEFQSVLTLVSSRDKISFSNSENRLSSFCEAVDEDIRDLKLSLEYASGLNDMGEELKAILEEDSKFTVPDKRSESSIHLRLREQPGEKGFLASYKAQASSTLATEIACRITTNTQSETNLFTSYDMEYDDTLTQGNIVLRIGTSNRDYDSLASSIATGLKGSLDEE